VLSVLLFPLSAMDATVLVLPAIISPLISHIPKGHKKIINFNTEVLKTNSKLPNANVNCLTHVGRKTKTENFNLYGYLLFSVHIILLWSEKERGVTNHEYRQNMCKVLQ
jgi:hypothetical protein